MAVAVVQRIIQLHSGHVQGMRRWWLAASGVAAATTTGLRRRKSTASEAGQTHEEEAARPGSGQGAAAGERGFGAAAAAGAGTAGFAGTAGGGGAFQGVGDAGGGGSGSGGGDHDAEEVRRVILEAALPFVHQVGWSREALSMGAEAAGYPGVAHGMFTGGGTDLVLFFIADCNARLEESLRARPLPPTPPPRPEERARFLQAAVRQRLEMVVPYAARWPQALALQANPRHAPSALALLLTMVDDVCFFAGDRDVDFSWYTHRITLAGIYKATELYMIQDKSEEHQKTWNFLERCIDDSTTMQKYLQQSKGTQIAKETITAAFVTARNILGLNTAR